MKRPAGKGNRSRDSSSFVVRVEEVRMDVDAFKLRTCCCFVFVVKFPQHPYVIHLCSWIFDKYGGGGRSLVAQSCPTLATPWTVALQAPLSVGLPFLLHLISITPLYSHSAEEESVLEKWRAPCTLEQLLPWSSQQFFKVGQSHSLASISQTARHRKIKCLAETFTTHWRSPDFWSPFLLTMLTMESCHTVLQAFPYCMDTSILSSFRWLLADTALTTIFPPPQLCCYWHWRYWIQYTKKA